MDELTEFSLGLRATIRDRAFISNLRLDDRVRSSDGTEKFLFGLEDDAAIEAVLIPEGGRRTLCVSSQVGCAMACRFCRTGALGLRRNLKAYEIVDQVIAVNRMIFPERVTNVVLMGMGEPLANCDEVIDALWRMVDFIGISKRRITVSTAGIVPGIAALSERAPEVNLAISLNATTDEVRNRIMPVNKRYPLRMLLGACRKFPLSRGRRITIEYVMMDGVNDFPEDARRLVTLLAGIRCKVNLIPLNPFPGCDFRRPPSERVLAFQAILMRHKVRTLIRESRGQDILAACGQLAAAREGGGS